MSTIQNLKNFIRHGKQARASTPHAEPTTNVSPIHAQQQRQPPGQYPPASGNLDAIENKRQQAESSQAAAAQRAADKKAARAHEAEIQQIVAEERQSQSKMPRYPGLERWILLEKMGDGAFSNVYRAKDSTGKEGEVAIKVVRKFEMNANQVRCRHGLFFLSLFLLCSLFSRQAFDLVFPVVSSRLEQDSYYVPWSFVVHLPII